MQFILWNFKICFLVWQPRLEPLEGLLWPKSFMFYTTVLTYDISHPIVSKPLNQAISSGPNRYLGPDLACPVDLIQLI